jgi:hypothetical protein
MRASFQIAVPVALGALLFLPLDVQAWQKSTGNSQPLVPKQFSQVSEGNWKIGMPLVGQEMECHNGKIRV